MSIILGTVPDHLILKLNDNSPFSTILQRADGQVWDPGTAIELRVGATVWPASIDGVNCSWVLSALEVATFIAETHSSLWYNGALWAKGGVIRNA